MNDSEREQGGNPRAGQQDQQRAPLEAGLAPRGPGEIQQNARDANKTSPNQRTKRPYFYRFEVVGAFVVGIALFFVGLAQCSVYWQQEIILKSEMRPNITLKGNVDFSNIRRADDGFFYFPATFINVGGTAAKVRIISSGGNDTKFDTKYRGTLGWTYSDWIIGSKQELALASFFRHAPDQIRNFYINKGPFRVTGWALYCVFSSVNGRQGFVSTQTDCVSMKLANGSMAMPCPAKSPKPTAQMTIVSRCLRNRQMPL